MRTIITLLLIQSIIGCSKKKTWLSDEIKEIVPYNVGQRLVFEASNGIQDSIIIINIEDKRFPDGLGAPTNERLTVYASRPSKTDKGTKWTSLLYLIAQDGEKPEEIQFEISLSKCFMYPYSISLADYMSKPTQLLESKFGRHNDVIKIVLPDKVHVSDETIREIYWSKSYGYLRLVQYDSTVWDLME
jgi:hypothetical protein